MPAFQGVSDNPAKVTMLLLCIFGTAFMTWFLVGLITERSDVRERYILRVKLGESRSVQALPDLANNGSFLEEAAVDKLQMDRTIHLPVHGFHIRQHF